MQSPFARSLFLLSLLPCVACTSSTNFGPEYQRRETTTKAATATAEPDPSAPVKKDPFEGAPAYAAQLPDARATLMHMNGKVSVVPGKDTKCLGCHGPSGDEAAAPKFVFGGAVFEDKEATTGAKDMELGIIDSAGKTIRVHSDEDGNFWAPGTPQLTYPAYASIRFNDMKKPMKKKIVDAAELECASCHDAANRIVKP